MKNTVEVELVANGGGAYVLVKGPASHAEQVGKLATKGVLLGRLCPFPERVGDPRDTLLKSVEVVSSGVGELVKNKWKDGPIFGLNMDPLADRPPV